MMITYFLSKVVMIIYGMLYPAFCSYKAVKNKDVKEYVHWMMYWIVFAIFNVLEIFADLFIGLWFPFYYETKILFMIWILSPTTRGGSTLYRRFIHPFFTRHEKEIDGYLAEFQYRTSNLIVQWSSKAFSYLTELFMNAVMKSGAGELRIMNKVTRTMSYENFDQPDMNRNNYQFGELQNPSEISESELEYSFTNEGGRGGVAHRHLYTANMRYGSVDQNIGRVGSKAMPIVDLSEEEDQEQEQAPPKVRTSNRKKKEDNAYGTLPRAKRTTRKVPK